MLTEKKILWIRQGSTPKRMEDLFESSAPTKLKVQTKGEQTMDLPICEFHQGDWLIPYDSDTPDQIHTVSFQEEMAGIWPIIQFRHNRNAWTYPSFCTRIELTEEFFEHNGFEYSPFSSGSYDYKDEDGNKLSFTKINGNNYWNCYFNDLLIPGKIEYVDDVQRMFGAFKIQKNIVL